MFSVYKKKKKTKQLARAHDQIVVPLENFRKERIGGVKENKKKFDKKTAKFCQAQERFLNMSSKKPDNTIQEVSFYLIWKIVYINKYVFPIQYNRGYYCVF